MISAQHKFLMHDAATWVSFSEKCKVGITYGQGLLGPGNPVTHDIPSPTEDGQFPMIDPVDGRIGGTQ